ncbi:MAG: hypothetical protein WA843_01465 [Candidatus Saccharimonadales bacterium]
MSSEVVRRVGLFTTKDQFVSYLRIASALEHFEDYESACAAAYNADNTSAPGPSQTDFERSLYEGATELRFVWRSEAELLETGRRVTEVLNARSVLAELDETIKQSTA